MNLQKNRIPSIAWNAIIKNEAPVLPRLLESIYPIVDYYCVTDTGSTDESKKIIKDFFDAKGIDGEIHDHPFIDFSNARNHALDNLRKSNKADYAMYIDADEQFFLKSGLDIKDFKNKLSKYDLAFVEVRQKNAQFSRWCFFKPSRPFRWEGKIHNALGCDEPIKKWFIKDEVEIKVNTDGNTWTKQSQKEKYLTHARILEEEVKKYNKPRDVFYLAQSYRDAFEPEKAIEWYQRRLKMKDGFYEEIYYSQLMIAGLKWGLKRPVSEVADEYMKCAELDTLKADHLFYLKNMYAANGRHESAKKIHELWLKYKNPYPARILFLNPNAYPDTKKTTL